MKRMICIVLVLAALLSVSVSAEEYMSITQLLEDTASVVAESQQTADQVIVSAPEDSPAEAQEDNGAVQPVVSPDNPLPVIVMSADDISAYSVSGSGYTGSFSSAILSYFEGVLAQNPKSDYVVFKSDRYNTYLFYGDDFTYSGSVFSGYGQFICYNSESQLFSRGSDSFSFRDSGYYVYTNLDRAYPVLMNVEGVKYEKVVPFALGVFFCLYAFDRIFFRRFCG